MKKDPILIELFNLVIHPEVAFKLAPLLSRVEAELMAKPKLPQAWEPLSPGLFGKGMPKEIKSCWFFVLRQGAVFGAERHPNSHQRSIALKGSCVFETFEKETWLPHPVSLAGKSVKTRAISIPPDTWHRITIGQVNFVSLSFHTVAAKELIEETPVGKDLTKTKRRLYHA
jgi:hypothetical protein